MRHSSRMLSAKLVDVCILTLNVTAMCGCFLLNNPHPIDHPVSLFCRETKNINRTHQSHPSDEGGQGREKGSGEEEEKGQEDDVRKSSGGEGIGEGSRRDNGLEKVEEGGGAVAEGEEVGRQLERAEHDTLESGGQVAGDLVNSGEGERGEGGERVKEEAGDKVEKEEGQEHSEKKEVKSEPKEPSQSLRPEEAKREVEPPAKGE